MSEKKEPGFIARHKKKLAGAAVGLGILAYALFAPSGRQKWQDQEGAIKVETTYYIVSIKPSDQTVYDSLKEKVRYIPSALEIGDDGAQVTREIGAKIKEAYGENDKPQEFTVTVYDKRAQASKEYVFDTTAGQLTFLMSESPFLRYDKTDARNFEQTLNEMISQGISDAVLPPR